MPRAKNRAPIKLEILANGVFVADGVRKDKGDIAEGVDPAVAAMIVRNGHGRIL